MTTKYLTNDNNIKMSNRPFTVLGDEIKGDQQISSNIYDIYNTNYATNSSQISRSNIVRKNLASSQNFRPEESAVKPNISQKR
jgi:hypothetical protein